MFFTVVSLRFFSILSDNVDTRGALDAVRDLIGNCNIYVRDRRASAQDSNCLLLRDIAAYITWLLRVFGAISTEEFIGFPVAESKDARNVSIAWNSTVFVIVSNFNVNFSLDYFGLDEFMINVYLSCNNDPLPEDSAHLFKIL
jgi:hypothetical protein